METGMSTAVVVQCAVIANRGADAQDGDVTQAVAQDESVAVNVFQVYASVTGFLLGGQSRCCSGGAGSAVG
jgi:hypothetical protein